MYYGGFTYTETYNLPVSYKRWFLDRLAKELKSDKQGENPPTKAAHVDTPQNRALQGNTRANVPARLKRFT